MLQHIKMKFIIAFCNCFLENKGKDKTPLWKEWFSLNIVIFYGPKSFWVVTPFVALRSLIKCCQRQRLDKEMMMSSYQEKGNLVKEKTVLILFLCLNLPQDWSQIKKTWSWIFVSTIELPNDLGAVILLVLKCKSFLVLCQPLTLFKNPQLLYDHFLHLLQEPSWLILCYQWHSQMQDFLVVERLPIHQILWSDHQYTIFLSPNTL